MHLTEDGDLHVVILHAGVLGIDFCNLLLRVGFPGSSDGKVSACNVGDLGLIPGSERSPGEENDNPLQYPCLENPMDREAW